MPRLWASRLDSIQPMERCIHRASVPKTMSLIIVSSRSDIRKTFANRSRPDERRWNQVPAYRVPSSRPQIAGWPNRSAREGIARLGDQSIFGRGNQDRSEGSCCRFLRSDDNVLETARERVTLPLVARIVAMPTRFLGERSRAVGFRRIVRFWRERGHARRPRPYRLFRICRPIRGMMSIGTASLMSDLGSNWQSRSDNSNLLGATLLLEDRRLGATPFVLLTVKMMFSRQEIERPAGATRTRVR